MDRYMRRPSEEPVPARPVVWYPAGFSEARLLATLPDDLEARRLRPGEPPVFPPDEAGVVIIDAADDKPSLLAISAVQGVKLPVVALLEPGQVAPLDDGECMYLTKPVAPLTVASVLRAACEQARLTREAQHTARQLEELNTIGVRLSAERDTTRLLDLILTKARTITRSDAGSIYLVETSRDGARQLRFELTQNDSVPVIGFSAVTLPLTHGSLAGHVALSGEMLYVDDAYGLPPGCSYRFNPEFDALVGYRTKSMLVVPMKTPNGDVIGVLELINCKRDSGRLFASPAEIERAALPYPEPFRSLAASLASQAAVALANSQLFQELARKQERLEKSQNQLIQVERLRALGEMAAGVAHDFNNLLAVIMLRTELLLARQQPPDMAESLTTIRQAAQDGAQTVRRIQEFTRTRSTRPFGRVNVPIVLREVVELTRPRWRDQAQSRGVTYDVRVEGDGVPPVAGSAEELREVFLNLLHNALEAMPGGGRVVLRLAVDGDQVVIHAADTGCGMSEETRRRVFEPFFTTKGAQGNGLGLAVVWGIVTRHHGEIAVESNLGAGTTFTVRLPVPTTVPPEEGAEPGVRVPAGRRVLVVEDNVEILKSLKILLTEHGCHVLEAPDGASALRRCDTGPVDLVLSDLAMPGMSGWEVAAAWRERFPTVPIGLITGFGNQLEPEKIEQYGVKFVVAKPFSADELLREVAGALQPAETA